MPQIILCVWKIIFSGSLLHKTPTPWLKCETSIVYDLSMNIEIVLIHVDCGVHKDGEQL